MVDHRRAPSQRAYQLPGWFFVLTTVCSLAAFAAVGWFFLGDRVDLTSRAPQAATSPSLSAGESEPSPSAAVPTPSPSAKQPGGADDQRPDTNVVVLNASKEPGLAATVAKTAEKAGWNVAEVGNWIYPAVVNAVYYPPGLQSEAEILADDVDVESVRPARSGMSTDELTVLLVYSP